MKKADLYEIAIKIAGLYFLYTTLDFMFYMVNTIIYYSQLSYESVAFGAGNADIAMLLSVSQFLTYLAFSILLLLNTKKMARIICRPEDYSEIVTMTLEKKTIFEIALVIMGLTIFVWTLPDFSIRLREFMLDERQTNYFDITFTLTSAVKIVVAFISIFFSRPISAFLVRSNKVQNA